MHPTKLITAALVYAVLSAGTFTPPASARRLPLDRSFGNAGAVESEFGPRFGKIEFSSVEPQPDGSILGVLRGGSEERTWLRRYEADGNRDLAYGQVGFHRQPEAIQSDGKVLKLAGGDALQRFEPDGRLDPSFGTQGYGGGLKSDSVPFSIEYILPMPSGNVVVLGTQFDDLVIARYDEQGRLDPGFGRDGVAMLGHLQAERLLGIAPRPDEGVTLLAADTARSEYGETVSHSGTSLLGLTSGGAPDPAYGEGGVAHLDGLVVDFHSLPGGGLLLAGDAWGSPLVRPGGAFASKMFLARYEGDGHPDPSFGVAGEAAADFGGLELAEAMLVKSDGSILLGGASTDTGSSYCLRFSHFCEEEPVLAGFTSSGQPDPTFGEGGKLQLDRLAGPYRPVGDNVGVMALSALPGDRILAGGGSGSAAFLAELSAGGVLEQGFGEAGIVTEGEPSLSSAAAHALGVDEQGRILVAGATDASLATAFPEPALFRYLPGGALDASYGGALGYVRVPAAARIAVARSGEAVVSSSHTPVELTRITARGQIDHGFGDEGTATLSSPRHGTRIASIALLRSGGVLAAGTTFSRSRIAIFRTRADGSPDAAFGKDGLAVLAFGRGHHSEVHQMTVDDRGRILIVGSVNVGPDQRLAVMRILPDGHLDPRFGRHGVTQLRVGHRGLASAIETQADGGILIAGQARHRSVLSDLLLRLRGNGGLDRNFAHRGLSWVRPAGKVTRPPEAILKLPRHILVLRRGRSGQVLAYRPGGRLIGSFSLPNTSKAKTIRPIGAVQRRKAVLAAQIRSNPGKAFELLRLRAH